jgi:ubiquinone/menaquinone biosynthesis C-methylase UbiE
VLDAGCGTGLLGRQLRKAGYRGELIGVDVAEKRLSEARHRRFGRGTVYSGVRRADLYRLPWREPVFDAVLTSGVLGLIGSRAVDELFRVLKPGGVFGVSVCYLNTKRSKLQYIAILYRLGALVNAGRLKPLSAWDLGTGYEGQKNSEHHDLIVYRKAA